MALAVQAGAALTGCHQIGAAGHSRQPKLHVIDCDGVRLGDDAVPVHVEELERALEAEAVLEEEVEERVDDLAHPAAAVRDLSTLETDDGAVPLGLTAEQTDNLVASLDTDGDGFIDYEEFLQALSPSDSMER